MAQTAKRKSGSQPPISAHPAFPAIVALWFAALFGIGSMVLPAPLMEQFLGSAPDFSTRLAIGGACAALGALGGILIARKVAAVHGAVQGAPLRQRSLKKADAVAMAKRPIVATEELGEEGLGRAVDDRAEDEDDDEDDNAFGAPVDRGPTHGRRRSLSVTDDTGPSEYLAYVPVPGEAEHIDAELSEEEATAPFGESVVSYQQEEEPMAHTDDAIAVFQRSASTQSAPPAESGLQPAATGGPDAERVPPAAPFSLELGTSDSEVSQTRRFDMPVDEVPLQAEPVRFDDPARAMATMQEVAPAAPDHSPAAQPETAHAQPLSAAEQAAPRPLAELTMSQLIERFASSLDRQRARQAEQASSLAIAASSAVPAPFDPFAAKAPAEANGDPAPVPFAFQRAAAQDAGTASMPEQNDAPSFAPVAEAAEPVPFFRTPAHEAAERTQDAQAAESMAVPSALRPLDLAEFEEEDEDNDPFVSGLSLSTSSMPTARPFDGPALQSGASAADGSTDPFEAAAAAKTGAEGDTVVSFSDTAQPAFQAPAPLDPYADEDQAGEDDEPGSDAGYSSLLNIKRAPATGHEFVRIDDDSDEDFDAPTAERVVFPGAQPTVGSAATAGPRPFDAPSGAPEQRGGLAAAVPTTPAAKPVDPAETEKALREALEKLQRMSGAA